MPFKTIEDRRAYSREYLRKKYAEDPAYRELAKARVKQRTAEGYFKKYQQKKRSDPSVKAKQAEYMRKRRAENPDHFKSINNKSKAKTRKERPHLFKQQQLRWMYGMSFEEYQQKLEAQGGVCFTCAGNNGGKALVVDHDHSKPKGEGNRGLLCNGCNVALGAVQEQPQVLRKLAEYLEAYRGA